MATVESAKILGLDKEGTIDSWWDMQWNVEN